MRKKPAGIDFNRKKVPEMVKISRQIIKKHKGDKKAFKALGLKYAEKGGWEGAFLAGRLLFFTKDIISNNEFEKAIYKLGDDKSWEAREAAAGLTKELLPIDFDYFLNVLKKMVKDKNPNIRRLAVVGSMQSKLSEKQATKVAQLIYRPLLNDENVYLRKNLGPFAVSQFLWLYPRAALAFFDNEMKTLKPRPVWNILNAFQTARLRANKDLITEAKKYLKAVADCQDKTIIAAATSLKRRLDSL